MVDASTRRMHTHALVGRALSPLMFAGLLVLGGCAKNERMMAASAEIPAAEGTVATERGDNDNTVVHIRVKHLAPPFRLDPEATTYVVWLKAAEAPIQSVGALKVDDDLVGRLDFVTPHRIFRLTVTPEAEATITAPSNRPVFTTSIDAR
jgi:hypothetical protein